MHPDGMLRRTGDNFLSSSTEKFLILTAKMNTSLTVDIYAIYTSFLVRQVNLCVMN
jgi:hypothetical protein